MSVSIDHRAGGFRCNSCHRLVSHFKYLLPPEDKRVIPVSGMSQSAKTIVEQKKRDRDEDYIDRPGERPTALIEAERKKKEEEKKKSSNLNSSSETPQSTTSLESSSLSSAENNIIKKRTSHTVTPPSSSSNNNTTLVQEENYPPRSIPYTLFATAQSIILSPLPNYFKFVLVSEVNDAVVTDAHPLGHPPTTENSWFDNRAHAMLVCKHCETHIGWSYANETHRVAGTTGGGDRRNNSSETAVVEGPDKFFGLALSVSKWYRNLFIIAVIWMISFQLRAGAPGEEDARRANAWIVVGGASVCILKMLPYLLDMV